ncbi:MAG: TRAP transporter large permease subunit [Spirochaetes bacterium]|nr:TRAP transporter large permease subunit [Spirochaetota bacterium]
MLFWFLGIFILLLLMGIPISFCLSITMLLLVLTQTTLPLILIPQQLIIGADNFTLMAIPFFMLAAKFMSGGGITKRIMDFVNSLIGWITGGLALVNVGANMLMAGLSGSSVADAAMMGSILIPAMKEKGYSADFSAALTSCASTIGIIIPPSIPMILLGFISNISVVRLFLGGVFPGILVGVFLMGVAYYYSRKNGYPKENRVGLREIGKRFVSTFGH